MSTRNPLNFSLFLGRITYFQFRTLRSGLTIWWCLTCHTHGILTPHFQYTSTEDSWGIFTSAGIGIVIGLFVYVVLIYLGIGVLLALPMLLWLIKKIDPITSDATLGFRLLALPGIVMLWPILLLKARGS